MSQLNQTKYPDFIITFDIANFIVDILIEYCGVAANRRKTIVEDLMWNNPTEFRFQSDFFFDKTYILFNLNNKLYLVHYSVKYITEIEDQLEIANNKLTELYKENSYAT